MIMSTESLIIDARQQLPWHRRFFSDTSTATMWVVWLLLWRPLLLVTGFMSVKQHHVLAPIIGIDIEEYLVALFACAAALLLWSGLPAKQVRHAQARQTSDYATYFDLPLENIESSRQSQICVVHHDENGKIIRIEQRELSS